jgi:hypothetical protein
MASTPNFSAEHQEQQQSFTSNTPSEPDASSQSAQSSNPPVSSNTATQGPSGKGIVHEGYIYGITDDSPLLLEMQQITTKKERYNFILKHGKKYGKVDFDTRRRGC